MRWVLLVCLVAWMLGCPGYAPRLFAQASGGTMRMAERLDRLGRQAAAASLPYMDLEQARILQQRIRDLFSVQNSGRDIAQLVRLQMEFAEELLHAGWTREAVEEYEKLKNFLASEEISSRHSSALTECYGRLAVSWFALGQREYEKTAPMTDAWRFPLLQLQDPSQLAPFQKAGGYLVKVLRQNPSQSDALWLLNLVRMRTGRWPESVEDDFRIEFADPSEAESFVDFRDVTDRLGIDVTMNGGSVLLEDFNNDGWLDAFVSPSGWQDQIRFFLNRGKAGFEEYTGRAGLEGLWGGLSMAQADFNNDGHTDLFVARGGWLGVEGNILNSLLRNNGDNTFTDVTEDAGLLTIHPTHAAAWLDYNGDGWLDLFVGNETTPGNINPCELFHNNGDGTFQEVSEASGITAVGYVKSVAAGDYNNDGRPDLYLSNLEEPNRLYENQGPLYDRLGNHTGWKFSDQAEAAGVEMPKKSFASSFFDFDNNGWLDVVVSDFDFGNLDDGLKDWLNQGRPGTGAHLYVNRKDNTFQTVSGFAPFDSSLHAMTVLCRDLDNDGWEDIFVGNGDPHSTLFLPTRVFLNGADGAMREVTIPCGLGFLKPCTGAAAGDVDNDGDSDLFLAFGGLHQGNAGRAVLLENSGSKQNWILLKLEGLQANRSAIGARVLLEIESPEGIRQIHRQVGSGGSSGPTPLRLELGLGQANKIRSLTVRWPDPGGTQVFEQMQLNRAYVIREGDEKPAVWGLTAFALPSQSVE